MWIHKRCSGRSGDLSLVEDSFRCKRCDGTLQEPDLGEDLVVNEASVCVKSLCYVEDTCGNEYYSIYASKRHSLQAV